MPDLERIFFATSDGDASCVERILDSRGIDYQVHLEVIEERRASGLCYQGLLYEVPPAVAAECRRAIVEQGLQRGIIDPPGQ